jgi:cytochrome c-type biogenesis protein CcmH/NrfG
MMGRAPEAIEVYQRALELEPKNSEAKVYLAIAYMYNNNMVKVKEILGDDTALLSDMKLLQVAESLKKYEFIIEVAQKKIKEDPNNAQFRVSLAAVYLKMGRNYDAIDQIKKAIEIEPAFKQQGEMYIQEIQSGRNPAQ